MSDLWFRDTEIGSGCLVGLVLRVLRIRAQWQWLQNLISMLDTARHGYSAAMKEQVEKTPGCKPLLVAQRFRLLDGMRALFRGVLYLVTVARAHVGVSDGSVRLRESLRVRTSKPFLQALLYDGTQDLKPF